MVLTYLLMLTFLFNGAVQSVVEPAPSQVKALDFIFIGSPPYVFSINGKMDGIYIEPVEKVVGNAGVDVNWVKMAPNRAHRIMQAGDKPFCVVTQGDFHRGNDIWWISKPFAGLGKIGLLVRSKDIASFDTVDNIVELVENSSLKGGFLRLGLETNREDHGFTVDENMHLVSDQNPFEMGQLVARARIDFIIVSEKAAEVHKSFYDEIEELSFLEMNGLVQKERKINILCTVAVPTEVRTRLDTEINKLNKKAAQ